jgi:hypothetical protein
MDTRKQRHDHQRRQRVDREGDDEPGEPDQPPEADLRHVAIGRHDQFDRHECEKPAGNCQRHQGIKVHPNPSP